MGSCGSQIRVSRRQFAPGSLGASPSVFLGALSFPQRHGCFISGGGGGIELLRSVLVGSLAGESGSSGSLSPGSGARRDNVPAHCYRTGRPGSHKQAGCNKINGKCGAS